MLVVVDDGDAVRPLCAQCIHCKQRADYHHQAFEDDDDEGDGEGGGVLVEDLNVNSVVVVVVVEESAREQLDWRKTVDDVVVPFLILQK